MNSLTFLSLANLFDSDIKFLNKITTSYKTIKSIYNQPLLFSDVSIGSVYLLCIFGILSPLIGILISKYINSHRGSN